jgi:Pentapeptide repeats (8 copies)
LQTTEHIDEALNKNLQEALAMATDTNKSGDARRISGIYQLQQFWEYEKYEPVVAATLSALLIQPEPSNPDVRCAAAEVIGGAYTDKNSQSERATRIAHLLYGYADGTWGLVSSENYLLRQKNKDAANEFYKTDQKLVCTTPMIATREAVRKNWENLRETNLQYLNLTSARLYQADLHGANLENTYLDAANLRCANLSNAILKGATIDNDTDIFLTNISGVDNPTLFAQATTVQLSDAEWQFWKKFDFSVTVLRQLSHSLPSGIDAYGDKPCR